MANQRFTLAGELLTLEAPQGDGPRKFKMLAYTGAPVSVDGRKEPVVIDLATLGMPKTRIPVLKDHSRGMIVGHTTEMSNDGRAVTATGERSGSGNIAQEVWDSAEKGFPWQASVGVDSNTLEFVPKGKTVQCNGATHAGPITVIRNGKLREISVVTFGADDQTAFGIAAQAAGNQAMTIDELETQHADLIESITGPLKAEIAKLTARVEAAEKPKPATIAELKAALPENVPGRDGVILAAVEAGKTLAEALTDAGKQLSAALAKAPAPTPKLSASAPAVPHQDGGGDKPTFEQLCRAEFARCGDETKAMLAAIKAYPNEYAEFKRNPKIIQYTN